MPRVKKGALVAYRLRTLELHESDKPGQPPTVTRHSYWALGTVLQASRTGRVKQITPAGHENVRVAMLSRYQAVVEVLAIPRDRVDAENLLEGARSVSWPDLPACVGYVAQFLLAADRVES